MKRILTPLIVSLLSVVSVTAQELPLRVEGAWMQAVPDSSSATATYMTLINLGKTALELVGARTTVAERVEPMITTKGDSGMVGMERVPSLPIPAGGKLILQPGGNHLMLIGLRQHPKPGDKVKMMLLINPGSRELGLEVPVSKQPIK